MSSTSTSQNKKKLLIMVGGASGSGKTTFAIELKKSIESSIPQAGVSYIHFFSLFEKYCEAKGFDKEGILKNWDALLLEFIKSWISQSESDIEVWDTHFAFRKKASPSIAFGKRVLSATSNFEATYSDIHIKEMEALFDSIMLVRIYADSELMFARIYSEAIVETTNVHPLAAIHEEKLAERNFMMLFHNSIKNARKLYLQLISNRAEDVKENLKISLGAINSLIRESSTLSSVVAKQEAK